jgi:16S rRNA processing protein RimM
VRARGLAGEMALRMDPSLAEDLSAGMPLEVRGRTATLQTKLAAARPWKEGLIVRMEGVGDRDAAEALVGAAVAVDRKALPPLEDGQYYEADLPGCRVFDREGRELGLVESVVATGANDVFIVAGTGGEILVPVIDPVVLELDVPGRRIVVEAEGLVWPEPPRQRDGQRNPDDR